MSHKTLSWVWLAVLAVGCWSEKTPTPSSSTPLGGPSALLAPPSATPYWTAAQPVGCASATYIATTAQGPSSVPVESPRFANAQNPPQTSEDLSSRPIGRDSENPPIIAWPEATTGFPPTAIRQVSADANILPAIGPAATAENGSPPDLNPSFAVRSPAAMPTPETLATPYPRRLEVPIDFPGANAPPIRLPPLDEAHARDRAAAIAKLFPPLPPLGDEFQATAIPQGKPLSIYDLEQMAREYSPLIRQAVADVRSAEGTAIQAGLYPNPTAGYEGDAISQGLTAGQQGGFIDQTIKTGGKLQLAKAAAQVGVANAQVALRKAQSDLASKVRGAYFSTLVAQENVRITHALARFSDEAYNVQVDMVKGGQAAAYEPLQLRVLVYQSRAALVQARNRYVSAWKQLAATLGLPGMPPAPLAGGVDAPVPIVRYDAALAHILSTNSDVITAQNTLHQNQISLRLAEVNRIPDLDAHVVVQRDFTTPPFGTIVGVSIGGPLPLWDRNQGNIMAAEAAVSHASEGPHQARDDLTTRLADAYERYQDNLKVIDFYRQWMLPDQVQAYRGAYQRHQTEPTVVAFADVLTAQQTLATTVTSYVAALGNLWQAVVDVGSLLETEDLFRMGDPLSVPQVPDLNSLCPLPCCHSCQPAAAAGWLGGDGQWPALTPGETPAK